MRSKRGPQDVPGDIETLAERVDTLAAIVRETSGSIAATRGEVASTERRLGEQLGERVRQDTERLGTELRHLQDQLGDLRRRSQAGGEDGPVSHDLSVLAERVSSLSSIVGETAGRIAAGEGGIAALRKALSGEGERVDEALEEIRKEMAALAARMRKSSSQPAQVQLDARIGGKLEALDDRIDGISGTVRETAGGLVSTNAALSRSVERVGALEGLVEERSEDARNATVALRRELASFRDHLAADPLLKRRAELLENAVQTLGDRVNTVSDIVKTTSGRIAAREDVVEALENRLTVLGDSVDLVWAEMKREHATLGSIRAEDGSELTTAQLEERIAPISEALERLTDAVGNTSEAAEQTAIELRRALEARVDAVERDQSELRTELSSTVAALETDRHALELALSERIGRVEHDREALESRIAEVSAAAHEALTRPTSDPGPALRTLAGRLEQIEADRHALVGRIDSLSNVAHETLGRPTADSPPELRELGARLEQIERDRETLAGRIDELSAVAHEALARPIADPTPALRELAARLERIESGRQALASELATAEAAWVEERSQLSERLEAIAGAALVAPASEDGERLVHELTVRLGRLERERSSVTELASLADGWTDSLATLAARVDFGLLKLDQSATSSTAGPDADELRELAERVASVERDRDTVVTELTRTSEAWSSERVALQERVAELAARIVTGPVDTSPPGSGGEATGASDHAIELDRLRIGLEGMRMRLAYHEKATAELGAKPVSERLDELSVRLDRLQHAIASSGGKVATEIPYVPAIDPGLGGLMHRVEQAERSARSSRDDVLLHLERLASRMDWRLQRLETPEEASLRS